MRNRNLFNSKSRIEGENFKKTTKHDNREQQEELEKHFLLLTHVLLIIKKISKLLSLPTVCYLFIQLTSKLMDPEYKKKKSKIKFKVKMTVERSEPSFFSATLIFSGLEGANNSECRNKKTSLWWTTAKVLDFYLDGVGDEGRAKTFRFKWKHFESGSLSNGSLLLISLYDDVRARK